MSRWRSCALLLAPIAAAIHDRSHWVIVPHGPLHRVPWAALRRGDRYLIEERSLSQLHSASFGAAIREPSAAAMGEPLFLAEPCFDEPPLPSLRKA